MIELMESYYDDFDDELLKRTLKLHEGILNSATLDPMVAYEVTMHIQRLERDIAKRIGAKSERRKKIIDGI